MKIEDLIYAWLKPAVRDWFPRQALDLSRHFHLYYKAGTVESNGAVIIAEDPPNSNWKLATPERVSPAKSMEQVTRWAYDICWRLPLLRTGGC